MALFVRRRWPKVLAAVAIAAAVGTGAWTLTRDSSPGPVAPTTGPDIETAEPVPEPTPDSVTVAALLAGGFVRYEDHVVPATTIRVQSVPGPSAAWVEPSPGKRLLLVLVGPSFTFQAGTNVTFTGAVRRGTPDFGRALGLSPADAAAFDGYVEVTTIAVAQRVETTRLERATPALQRRCSAS